MVALACTHYLTIKVTKHAINTSSLENPNTRQYTKYDILCHCGNFSDDTSYE